MFFIKLYKLRYCMMVILQVIINRNNSFLRIILKSVEIFVVTFEVFLIELNSQATSLKLFNLCRKVDTFKLRFYQIQTNSILFFMPLWFAAISITRQTLPTRAG